MAEFSSVITISAGQAIDTLDKLDVALDKAAISAKGFQTVVDKNITGAGFADVANGARKATAELLKVEGAAKRARTGINGVGLGFKDVVRIVESQVIFSALNGIRQGFFDAADAAAKFQEQVARITAIDESSLGFDGLRAEIEKLAVTLGRPIEEVGTAAFEALQNDIGTTEETFATLSEEAQQLALVTGGTLPQAVNALSSVYKTFGKNAEGVTSVSGQFFGTINAGRITLADLESSLGTLSPLATELGVNFKELTDAVATITLTGTKADVASTQLRNVFNKLLKPTEALQKVYQDLGVKGFEELSDRIGDDGQRLGLVGALSVLRNQVGDSEDGLSRLFNTIRGQLGVLNVLTDDTRLYDETVRRSTESAARLGEAIQGIESTDARQAAKNAATLEVIFTRLGDTALRIKNDVIGIFLGLTASSEEGVVAVGAFSTILAGATLAVTKFGVAAGVAFPPALVAIAVLAGAGAIAVGVNALGDAITKTAKATAELEVERVEALVVTLQQLRESQLELVTENLNNVDTVINRIATSAKNTGSEITKAFTIEAGNIGAVEASILQAFGDARNRVLSEIEQSIKDIDKAIADGTKRISSIQQEIEGIEFEFEIEDLSEAEQANRRLKRSTDAIAQAYKDIANVGLGEQSQNSARESAEAARETSEAALQAARRAGNERQIEEAKRQLISAVKTELALETRLNNLRKDFSSKDLVEQQQQFEKLSASAKQQLDDVVAARKAIADAEVSGLPPEQTKQLQENLVKEVKEAQSALQEAAGSTALETFDLKTQFEQITQTVKDALNETQVDWTAAINSLRENLANAPDLKAAVELTAKVGDLASGNEGLNKVVQEAIAQGGLPGEQLERTQQAVLNYFKEQKTLSDTVEDSSVKAQSAADRARFAFAESIQEAKLFGETGVGLIDPILEKLSTLGDLNAEQLAQLIKNLESGVEAVAEQTTGIFGTFTPEQQAKLTEGVRLAIEAAQAQAEGLQARNLFNPENLAAGTALIEKISTTDLSTLGFEVDSEGFQGVNDALEKIELDAQAAKNNVKAIGTEAAPVVSNALKAINGITGSLTISANNAKSAYQSLLDIAQEALRVAQEAASLNSSNSGQGLFFGGRPTFRNDGGNTRGLDTMPVMANPDEFFVNATSSRNFLPELQAINAGNAPSSSGGVGDTNITIGDINVSSSSDVPSQTARDIALSIKRELRRGTSRL